MRCGRGRLLGRFESGGSHMACGCAGASSASGAAPDAAAPHPDIGLVARCQPAAAWHATAPAIRQQNRRMVPHTAWNGTRCYNNHLLATNQPPRRCLAPPLLQDEGVIALGTMLKSNAGLVLLDLTNTRMGAESCLMLSEGVKGNKTLEVSGGGAAGDGAAAVACGVAFATHRTHGL